MQMRRSPLELVFIEPFEAYLDLKDLLLCLSDER